MKLLDFYKSILEAAGLNVNSSGYVSIMAGESKNPFLVDGKRLILPTKENLANPDKSEVVFFQPLTENTMRETSPVTKKFTQALVVKLNNVAAMLTSQMVNLAASPAEHRRLSPDQLTLMMILKDMDDKMAENWTNIVKKISLSNATESFVHIFIKRKADLNGRVHSRGAIVTFPLYERLLESDGTLLGVKLRKKDLATFKAFLEAVFPNIGVKHAYSRGSENPTAPTIDAVLRGFAAVATPMNDLTAEYKNVFDSSFDELNIESEWMTCMESLDQFLNEVRMIPMQTGSDGAVPVVVHAPAPMQAQPVQQPQPPVWGNPTAPVQSTPVDPNGVVMGENGIDYVATMQMRNGGRPAPAQGYGGYPNQFGMQYPPMTNAEAARVQAAQMGGMERYAGIVPNNQFNQGFNGAIGQPSFFGQPNFNI